MTESIKILILSHTGNYPIDVGGPQAVAYFTSLHLARMGCQVTLYQRFTSETKSKEWKSTPEALSLIGEGVQTINFNADYSIKNIWRYPRYILRAVKELDGISYDFIHYNSPPVDANLMLPRRVAALGLPQSVAIHGGLFYESKNILGRRIFRIQTKYMSVAVVFNNFSKRIAKEQGFSEGKIRMIPNGVDVGMVDSIEPKQLEGQPSVVYAGRLEPVKGIETLLDAARDLSERLKHFRLYVAGSGSLERLVKEYSERLAPNVVYLGRLPRVRDVLSLVKGAHLAVLPSLKENFSVSLLEGMASGTPLVVSDAEGNMEVVSENEVYVFKRGSPQSLAQTIERAYADYETSRKKAGRAKMIVRERYEWSIIAREYYELFRSYTE
jgi:glycosyltransferase involved in cell wall biosynthesis